MRYLTDEQLEQKARAFLRKIGLEFQVRPDLMTVIAKVRHLDPSFNYARVPDELLPDAEACWVSEARSLRLRESVFVDMQRQRPRARMTVGHELAHYVLGHEGHLNRSVEKTISELAVARVRHQESEARRMGPIILAPEHLIPDGATAEPIAQTFSLSLESALYRKDEVDRLRRRRRGADRPLPASVLDYLREAKRRGLSVRTPFDD